MVMSSLIRPTHFPTRLLQVNVKLLRYLGGTDLEIGRVMHTSSILSNQYSGDTLLKTNALNALYSECKVGHVFYQMHKQNIVSWSALISGHFQNGSAFEVLNSFKSMVSEHDESCPPDNYISSLVLKSCIKVGYVSLGRQCHGYMLKSGLVFHHYVKSALLNLYCVMSDMVGAVEVYISVPGADNCAYHLLSFGADEKRYLKEAFSMLRRMLAEDMVWNKATYIGLFGLCVRISDLDLGRQVHNKLLKSEVEFDVCVCNALIRMYGKPGHVVRAVNVFNWAKDRDVVSWTFMMGAALEGELVDDSLMYFCMMQRDDHVVPNERTFHVALNASAIISSVRCGKMLHALVEKTGVKGHKNVNDALIHMYLETGNIKAAEKVFLGMSYRDITTFNMMIHGYCLHGFGKKSLNLFQEMSESGGRGFLNDDAYVGVLNACGELRAVETGFYYFDELMRHKRLKPGLEHYRCMANILIKDRQLEEAFEFVESTPILKHDSQTWRALTRACDTYHEHYLRVLIQYSIPDYVMASEFEGFTDFHELMEVNFPDLLEPRMSWFENKNGTYKFESVVKGDPQFVEHDNIMKPLLASIKAYDDEDEIKEDSSCEGYHSEKLAIAYALMKTHKSAPISIMMAIGKMCRDCHSFMKVISKAKKRLIMVKDSKRFHHFQDGRCSCRDY